MRRPWRRRARARHGRALRRRRAPCNVKPLDRSRTDTNNLDFCGLVSPTRD
jgi:hypothetical protein